MGWTRHSLNEIRKLKQRFGGGTFTIELSDGSRVQFAREDEFPVLFTHFMQTLRCIHRGEPRPEPPALLKAIADAKDRERAFYAAFGEAEPFMPYEERALVERGEFTPKMLVPEHQAG